MQNRCALDGLLYYLNHFPKVQTPKESQGPCSDAHLHRYDLSTQAPTFQEEAINQRAPWQVPAEVLLTNEGISVRVDHQERRRYCRLKQDLHMHRNEHFHQCHFCALLQVQRTVQVAHHSRRVLSRPCSFLLLLKFRQPMFNYFVSFTPR